jgi:hypothetical protein
VEENMDNKYQSKKVALGGILAALAVICLFFAATLPTARLSLYALSSFFVSVVILEAGVKAGWLFYAATVIVSIIVIPDKIGVFPYVIFFGLYGIVKYYIEKLGKLIPEYIIKFAYFNACFFAAVFFLKELFMVEVAVKLPWGVIIAAFEIIFFIYDWVYTMFIDYYRNKIKTILKL